MGNTDKKKLLFIVEAMGGGVFTYIVDLANELCSRFDVYIAYATRRQTPENYLDYFDPSIHMIRIHNFTREINLVKDVKAFAEIRKVAGRIKPDIIHLHSSKAGVIGRFAFNGKKIPLFYTPHGYSFLMRDCSSLKRFAYRTIEAVCARRNCTTISCSKGEHEETLQLTKKAAYVNNGINIQMLEKTLNGITVQQHDFTVFTLGRITYQKNPKLFNQIALAMPKVHFLWIGDGELRDELSAPNIEITGWLERKEALRRSVNADVFLLTSLWEGLPISLLEAMYMKKLCVVSDVIGNHDVIRDGDNGFVCRTVNGYKKAIETKDTAMIRNNGYMEIINEYNTRVMGEKYSVIYLEALR